MAVQIGTTATDPLAVPAVLEITQLVPSAATAFRTEADPPSCPYGYTYS